MWELAGKAEGRGRVMLGLGAWWEPIASRVAVGATRQRQDKVAEYIDAGVTCPILYPMMDDIKPVIDAFAEWDP
jgi:hypothetical protein